MYHVQTWKKSSWRKNLKPTGGQPYLIYSAILGAVLKISSQCISANSSYRFFVTDLKLRLCTLTTFVIQNDQSFVLFCFFKQNVSVMWRPFWAFCHEQERVYNFSVHHSSCTKLHTFDTNPDLDTLLSLFFLFPGINACPNSLRAWRPTENAGHNSACFSFLLFIVHESNNSSSSSSRLITSRKINRIPLSLNHLTNIHNQIHELTYQIYTFTYLIIL